MKKIGIITDSTACLNFVDFHHESVRVIDFVVVIDGVPHKISTLDSKEFYKDMDDCSALPTTAIASVQDVLDIFNDFKRLGYTDIIVMTVSSKLSGSLNNITCAAQDVEDMNIHVIDSLTTAFILGDVVIEASKLIDEGQDVDKILTEIQRMYDNDNILIYVDTLKNLVKGGRMSGAIGMVGEVFKIKPILELGHDGTVKPIAKNRTAKKSIKAIKEMYLQATEGKEHKLYLFYTDNKEEILKLEEELLSNNSSAVDSSITGLSPVVSTHTGAGAFGIGWRFK
ncbi:DegV family protein [Mycoplasmatota bacterium zrk1]